MHRDICRESRRRQMKCYADRAMLIHKSNLVEIGDPRKVLDEYIINWGSGMCLTNWCSDAVMRR
jgi:hypothetical protein